MRKSALELMAPTNTWVQPKPEDVSHYVDPHSFWHGGETVRFGGSHDTELALTIYEKALKRGEPEDDGRLWKRSLQEAYRRLAAAI